MALKRFATNPAKGVLLEISTTGRIRQWDVPILNTTPAPTPALLRWRKERLAQAGRTEPFECVGFGEPTSLRFEPPQSS